MCDPDTDWVNLGTYRVMMRVKNTVGLWMSPGKHVRLIREQYFKDGKPCPVAISVGHDPLLLAAGGHPGNYFGRFVVVVDEDIDPTDIDDLTWAMASRCGPEHDIDIIRNAWSGPLDPRKNVWDNFNSRALVDACRPYEWKDDFPHVAEASPEERARIKKKIGHLLDGL